MGLASQRAIHLLKGRYERRGRRFTADSGGVVVSQSWNHPDPALALGKTCNCDVGPARTEMMRNYLDRETIKLRISK